MSYLMRVSSKLLGTRKDFERESYLEGFIYSNPGLLSGTDDPPEDLMRVYILGRQEMCKIWDEDKTRKGITDLICLIWNPDLEKYLIWIYELKVNSSNIDDVRQLLEYLDAIELPENRNHKDDIIRRAQETVGKEFVVQDQKIRGALCSHDFNDAVMGEIINNNISRPYDDKILAVKICRFPVGDEVFVMVECLIGEDDAKIVGRKTYYDDKPEMPEEELKESLKQILEKRKQNYPERFNQLRVFLEMLAENPTGTITQRKLRDAWVQKGLPEMDRGMSISQPLGHKDNGALRQLIAWDVIERDIKDNYRLQKEAYSKIIKSVLINI